METYVVGLDDSPHAARALRWALKEADWHGARAVVVHAWDWPYEGETGALANDLLERLGFDEAAGQLLEAMVRTARGPGSPDVELELRVVQEPPAKALLDASAGADLLVVGSRGRGALRGVLLGSVSQQCAAQAECPVVVVPLEGRSAA